MVLAGKLKEAGLRGENRRKQDGYEKYEWKGIKTHQKKPLISKAAIERVDWLNLIMGMKSSL